MMKKLFKSIIVLIGLFILTMVYVNSSTFIKTQEWKYSNGKYIGDWLEQSSFEINDRIIQTRKGKAKIISSNGRTLTIEDIDTKIQGYYINK